MIALRPHGAGPWCGCWQVSSRAAARAAPWIPELGAQLPAAQLFVNQGLSTLLHLDGAAPLLGERSRPGAARGRRDAAL